MKRETHRLTPAERLSFAKLRPWQDSGSGRRFWWAVAADRGLDGTTVIGVPGDPYAFTALPIGHRKHWCWPQPLTCKKTAAELEREEQSRARQFTRTDAA